MEKPQELLDVCKDVLYDNQRGDYTVPAPHLYPHQWLWDSCFVAIGLSNYDVPRAQKEITSLLRGQWSNGMLPNMIFADGDDNARDRNMWQSWRSPHAPDGVATSGITQPPMLAEAIVRIGKKLDTEQKRQWYLDVYPALLNYHEWLYRERDPHEEGLVLLIHPWESGLDNTPPWTHELHMHQRPWWATSFEKLGFDSIVNRFRRDTAHRPPGERISNMEALLYYNVVRRLRRKNWDIDGILNGTDFAVQDLTFNCVLLRAHEHLKTIAKTIGYEVPEWINDRARTGRSNVREKLWDAYTGQFYSRNFVTHKLIKEPSIATLMPLYAGIIEPERAQLLVKLLKSKKQYWGKYPIPSVPFSSEYYKETGYWQGSTWINTNWLAIDGLKRYQFTEEATEITSSTIDLVSENGPSEYFSAKTGRPAGAENFSWTAALIIDLINKH
ncbi:MAG: glycoside hydrolase [bacterium]|nr:glycoside hydrolase [bacterium]